MVDPNTAEFPGQMIAPVETEPSFRQRLGSIIRGLVPNKGKREGSSIHGEAEDAPAEDMVKISS
jgi:hypothetical protein